MILVNHTYEIQNTTLLSENVVLFSNGVASLMGKQGKLEYNKLGYLATNGELLAVKGNGEIVVFDNDLVELFKIECDKVKPMSGLHFLGGGNIVILNFTEGYELIYISSGKEIFERRNFWGTILSEKYVLNYPSGTFGNPSHFRCSDLLDEVTYWEYDCGEGYEAGRFLERNNKLVFAKSKDLDVWLVVIDLPTGTIDWEAKILYGAYVADEKKTH